MKLTDSEVINRAKVLLSIIEDNNNNNYTNVNAIYIHEVMNLLETKTV